MALGKGKFYATILSQGLKEIISKFLDYIIPYRCISCRELLDKANALCGQCFKDLHFITEPFCIRCGVDFAFTVDKKMMCGKCIMAPPYYDLARSLWKFDEHSKKIIHRFKYNDHTSYAKLFAELICARYQDDLGNIDMIIPVPMHRLKRLIRYYNPPQIFAQELSKILNCPILADGLIKKKLTKSQTYLSKQQREKNISGSIVANSKYDLGKKTIILVDDVKTTGNTSNYCAKILKKAGASSVKLVTICSV